MNWYLISSLVLSTIDTLARYHFLRPAHRPCAPCYIRYRSSVGERSYQLFTRNVPQMDLGIFSPRNKSFTINWQCNTPLCPKYLFMFSFVMWYSCKEQIFTKINKTVNKETLKLTLTRGTTLMWKSYIWPSVVPTWTEVYRPFAATQLRLSVYTTFRSKIPKLKS